MYDRMQTFTTDQMTRLYNRVFMWRLLTSEVHTAHREQTGVGLILLDLDHLKQINDTHGHAAGDEVIVPSHTYVATWLAVSHTGANTGCQAGAAAGVLGGITHGIRSLQFSAESLAAGYLLQQVVWITVLGALAIVVWSRGVRRYVSQGG